MDITVLGNAANTAARLASEAKTSEILISWINGGQSLAQSANFQVTLI